MNNNIILVVGKSSTGKTASLRNLENQEGVWYLNCESNKGLPFKNKFKKFTITDPMQVYEAFDRAEEKEEVHTIVVDSLTYLMDMYETQYVLSATNTMKAWGEYAQFFKTLMSQYVANSSKRVIFIAHTSDVVSDDAIRETLVKVKGSIMDKGVESAFSSVVACKTMPLKKLEDYKNPLLNITEDDEINGYKHVFQTIKTKETTNERIRASLGIWDRSETFIDNDINLYLERIEEFYAENDEE
ncbi:MAG: AAA family ATPase [Acinetobacter junii]